jgi:hypothetical protein
MEITQEVAQQFKINVRTVKGYGQRAFAKLALACALLLCVMGTTVVHAAPPAQPTLLETDWQTGQIEVCYTGVPVGNTVVLYTSDYKNPYMTVRDNWEHDGSSCRMISYFENGQTVFHYIVSVNALGEESIPSLTVKQTPPLTVYVINWPDMLKDLEKLLNDVNQKLMDHMDGLATPSQAAMDNMKDAVDKLKDATGASEAGKIGDSLKAGKDDGNGTFTGGSKPEELPPLVGTANEMTICFHLTKDMRGEWFDVCIFNNEQLEKMKWWDNIRKIIGGIPFIMFGVWIVTRFTPQFKV